MSVTPSYITTLAEPPQRSTQTRNYLERSVAIASRENTWGNFLPRHLIAPAALAMAAVSAVFDTLGYLATALSDFIISAIQLDASAMMAA